MSHYQESFLSLWPRLQIGQSYWIIDNIDSEFWLLDLDDSTLKIGPKKNIIINKQAFVDVINYLVRYEHYQDFPCEYKIDEIYERSSVLDNIVRDANPHMQTSVLNYVLSILKALNIVDIRTVRPNATWLIKQEEV